MRAAIISDVHANLAALRATLDDIAGQRVEWIVCLGDIVGYNAEPASCIALLRQAGVLCVAGNHDRAVAGQIPMDGFSPLAARAVAWTRARLGADDLDYLARLPLRACVQGELVAVHGALHPAIGCEWVRLDSDALRRLSFNALAAHASGARICAFGHTHHLGIYGFRDGQIWMHQGDEATLSGDTYYLINPGTVGQPRSSEKRATYLLLDTAPGVITVRRVAYDAALTLAKTRQAGLLPLSRIIPVPVRSVLGRGARGLGRLSRGGRP
ncbi:MAG TPA: metallophosphoesterase family protein [Acetobacteraceae bacterium]